MIIIYQIILIAVALPATFLWAILKPGSRIGWFTKKLFPKHIPKEVKTIIHGASVGEINSAKPIVDCMDKDTLIITSTTKSGCERAKSIFPHLKVQLLPFDIFTSVNKFLKNKQTTNLILIEGDIWPFLVRKIKRKKGKIAVVNARITPKAFNLARMSRFYIKTLLEIDLFLCQNKNSKHLFEKLGIPEKKLRVTGNIKFDISIASPTKDLVDWVNIHKKGRKVVVAGSLIGEEIKRVIKIAQKIKSKALIVIAPRKPEEFIFSENLAKKEGIKYSTRNQKKDADLLILNSIGELPSLYKLGDIAIIGGSFIKKGGHNPIEPSLWKKPIIVGQHMNNFPDIEKEFDRAQAWLRSSFDSLEHSINLLLEDDKLANKIGAKAYEIVKQNKGAVIKTINILKEEWS